jgi:uridine kinase
LDCKEARRLFRQIKKDYEARGIEVYLEMKQYRTGKRKDIEAIEIYKKEKGISFPFRKCSSGVHYYFFRINF